jgi:hypothetical protein
MHRRRWLTSLAAVALLTAALLTVGCSNTLETGYKPRKLGASNATRRSYYASPFTPEARAAELEREQELEKRRPTPGY